MDNKKYIAGIITPNLLHRLETDKKNFFHVDSSSLIKTAFELRYDLFENKFWNNLSGRIRKIDDTLQIGTIRLITDGGKFNMSTDYRLEKWKEILSQEQIPNWIDLEHDRIRSLDKLREITDPKGVKILMSRHWRYFTPFYKDMRNVAEDAIGKKIPGLKLVVKATKLEECNSLFRIIDEYKEEFEFLAVFAQGDASLLSRIKSLRNGSNLSYGTILPTNAVEAPEAVLIINGLNKGCQHGIF